VPSAPPGVTPTRAVGPRRQRANEQQNEEDDHDGRKHFIISFVIPDALIALRKQSSMRLERFGEWTMMVSGIHSEARSQQFYSMQ
jgi:hypothetical protein